MISALPEETDAEHRALFAALVESLPEPAWLVDSASLRIATVNRAAERLLGLERASLLGRGARSLAATPEDLAFWDQVADGGDPRIHSDTLVLRADGLPVPVTRHVTPLADGTLRWLLVTLHDRSEQRRTEAERDTVIAELRATLESTADGILVTDLVGRIQAFNRRFAQLWGLPAELLQRRDDAAIHAWMTRSVEDPQGYAKRLAAIQEATLLHSRDRLRLHSGHVLERVTLPQWSNGRPTGRVYSFRDQSEKLAADQRIEALAHTDALTGVPNRHQLTHRLAYALALARRDGTPFALLHVDLDRFRQINDSFGSGIGDRVLIETSERVLRCLREVDMLARIGGDSFVVLIHHADARGAETTARRVLEVMAQPFTFEDTPFTVTCSIGIALYPGDAMSADALLRHAEAAMRGAKEGSRGGFRFHQPRVEVDLRSRMRLDHAMRQALAQKHFRVHYQPQIDLQSGQIIGTEALLRWRDAELGEVPPAEFIPVAEESGFIVAIGEWVLDRAVRQAADWLAQGWRMPVSVNVSALQFRQPAFVDGVAAVLAAHGLPAELLELELTESILLRDADGALQRVQALAERGVRLAIDDFGTGYSSLGYLKRLPISRLKIDRSFVAGLPADASDAGIVRAVMQLAQALQLRVVAEGVETPAQRQFLRDVGCDEYQGFLYAAALDSSAFEQRLVPQLAERLQ